MGFWPALALTAGAAAAGVSLVSTGMAARMADTFCLQWQMIRSWWWSRRDTGRWRTHTVAPLAAGSDSEDLAAAIRGMLRDADDPPMFGIVTFAARRKGAHPELWVPVIQVFTPRRAPVAVWPMGDSPKAGLLASYPQSRQASEAAALAYRGVAGAVKAEPAQSR